MPQSIRVYSGASGFNAAGRPEQSTSKSLASENRTIGFPKVLRTHILRLSGPEKIP